MAQDETAKYVESEAMFFPPHRLVRFNPDLTLGDDLLLQHICRINRCAESEGKRAIQAMVLQLRGQLLADGIVDFGSIGIFTQDEDGDIQFSACQAGTLTPALYGLDAFNMPRLSAKPQQRGKARRRDLRKLGDEHQFITIQLNRRVLRRTLAAAAVVLLVVLFTVPLDMVRRHQSQMASVFPTESVSLESKAVEAVKPTTQPSEAVKPATQQSEAVKPVTVATPVEAAPAEAQIAEVVPENNYAIVFACNISKKNAERYVGELQAKGISNARVIESGKVLRVVADRIATEAEAYAQVRELHAMGTEFADVWVMKL